MVGDRKLRLAFGLASAAMLAISAPAVAGGSLKDEPVADSGRTLSWSVNLGATSDYVFRGFSQNAEKPAVQGGADLTYGLFYAGVWASMVDFGSAPYGYGNLANTELDLYAGIKPTWGKANFDFGVIYYTYPKAKDAGAELNYVELKAGVSAEILPKLTTGVTVYYSPDYTGETGNVWTVEGTAAYELPKVLVFTPSINGTLGYNTGDSSAYKSVIANGDDNYLYWNAGLSLAVNQLTLDFRYWDTNISDTGGFCSGKVLQCDERFVFSAKITLP
jgi:uncharacterized protein (TIGR02001 family)